MKNPSPAPRSCLVGPPPFDRSPSRSRSVFLLVGQSNMAGRGVVAEMDRATDPSILAWAESGSWEPAAEPLHFDKPAMVGVGPGLAFARAVRTARPKMEIGLVPAAMGGSSLAEWAPGEKLFVEAVSRARAARAAAGGYVAGILWHQGESDCDALERAASYASRAAKTLAAFRAELMAAFAPVIVGELGEYLYAHEQSPYARTVNEQIAALPALLPKVGVARSHGLTHGGDGVHLGAEAAREFGRRYAAKWLELATNS